MRFHLIAAAALASVAIPAAAQRAETPEKRIERLEQELRAVQRRVFQDNMVTPEVGPGTAAPAPTGVPATSAVADLTARLDSIEGQLRALTGQAEEDMNRLRQIEATVSRNQESVGARLDALEKAGTSAQAAAEPANRPAGSRSGSRGDAPVLAADGTVPDWVPAGGEGSSSAPPGPAAAPGGKGAEAAYNAGFKLWEQKRYGDAVAALEEVVRAYPGDRWASWAGNLAGRAYLDDGKPTAAARAFFANYQSNPKGERAADSLYFLGQSLLALKKPADACKAYDELQDVYGKTMRDWLRQRLPAARAEAKCR